MIYFQNFIYIYLYCFLKSDFIIFIFKDLNILINNLKIIDCKNKF